MQADPVERDARRRRGDEFALLALAAGRCTAQRLLREASAELARLRRIRGPGRRTARRVARARALCACAAGLLGAPLGEAALAHTPVFVNLLEPFGIRDVGVRATPSFADLDGDGDLDALVGEADGNVVFFANTGTASAPAFAAPATNPFGLADVGAGAAPSLADLDGDGDLDALVGEADGNVVFFANTGTASAPAFALPVTNPFGLADVGAVSFPAFADLDGDGDLDALVGELTGAMLFFANTGSPAAPAFAPPLTNPFGLGNLGMYVSPTLADLDGDGDLDALVGEVAGSSFFLENTGTANAPAFAAALTNPFGLAVVGSLPSPALADLDGDRDLDAVVGGFEGLSVLFANTGTAVAPAFLTPIRFAVGAYAEPDFADLDGDGDLDALVGDQDGNVNLFVNSGSASKPAFAAPSVNPFGLADSGYLVAPAFVDIDGDGDLDAFVGALSGNTFFFANLGSPGAPAFASPLTNPFGLADVGDYSSPALADLDGDGDLDALIGNHLGQVLGFVNTGSASLPAFAAPAVGPFGLTGLGQLAAPAFADVDGDGDLDAFVGNSDGDTLFLTNFGASTAPVFLPPSRTPSAWRGWGSPRRRPWPTSTATATSTPSWG